MNEIQRMFQEECRERKALARQSRYVKKGSRSKRCPMPSDYYTPKQLRERNGVLMSINLAEPVEWKSFKRFPMDIQKEYVQRLIRQYGTTATDLSRVFGVTPTTISAYCKENDFGVIFKRGAVMPVQRKAAFERFLLHEKETPPPAEEHEPEEEIPAAEPVSQPPTVHFLPYLQDENPPVRSASGSTLRQFRLEFKPGAPLDDIFNSIRYIVSDPSCATLTVEGKFFEE